MNFLNFLTAGASLFNFNLNSLASSAGGVVEAPTAKIPAPDKVLSPEETTKIKQEMEVITQHQHLINQFMHMNIQMLSQKLESLEKNPGDDRPKQLSSRDDCSEQPCGRKKNKKINKCGHEDKQHYAKGLCNNCYHKYGRTKKPWNCPHDKLYAAGMCQNCYINNYNRKKRVSRDSNPASQPEHEIKVEDVHDAELDSARPDPAPLPPAQ